MYSKEQYELASCVMCRNFTMFFVCVIFAVVVEEFYESIRDDYDKLNKDLGQTWILEKPLLEIGTKALGKLGDINIITTAFRRLFCPFLCGYSY